MPTQTLDEIKSSKITFPHKASATNEAKRSFTTASAAHVIKEPACTTKNARMTPRLVRMLSLMASDSFTLLLSCIASFVIASAINTTLENHHELIQTGPIFFTTTIFTISLFVQLWCSWIWGHYTRFRPAWIELKETIKLAIYIGAISIGILFIFKQTFSRLWVVLFVLILCAAIPLGRLLTRGLLIKFDCWFQSTYIVGTGWNAINTAITLTSDPALGHRVDGFVDLKGDLTSSTTIMGKKVHSNLPNWPQKGLNESSYCAIFAFDSMKEMNENQAIVNQYIAMSSFATLSPPVNAIPLYGAEIISVLSQDSMLLKLKNNLKNRRSTTIKRLFDILVSFFLLLLLSPLMLILAYLTSRDGGKCIYGHERIGRQDSKFKCLKFRSMTTNSKEVLDKHLAENEEARKEWDASQKLKNDPRVTPIGKFIRTTSLDELPQLFNVLKGEMSLVGPRPIVADEKRHYGEHISYYLSTLPGITGLWQTSGRSDTTYKERVLLDVWYSRNWSMWLDIVLLLRTVPSLIRQTGAR